MRIFAPGTDIYSAADTADNSYVTMTGTSFAAPHVAGAAAQILAQNPRIHPRPGGDLSHP